ncbi:MAG: amino acid permease [Planctomycetaceae bacterium]
MNTAADATTNSESNSQPLGVWDAASLIVGIVIGASLFRVPSLVFSNVPDAGTGLFLWLAGGLLSLAGALCYCELATAWPRLGGDYVYLTRAYGPAVGFLFGWMRFAVILPANVGAMAFIFAEHARRLCPLPTTPGFAATWTAAVAAMAVVVLTALNLRGALFGKRVQNALTASKLIGLLLIIVAGFWLSYLSSGPAEAAPPPAGTPAYGLALVFILYAYGGWSDAAFVAAEVRDVRRNMPRALLLGLGTITALYVIVNVAYLAGLGLNGVKSSATPAAELLARAWGPAGEAAISLIVMISTLGAINGLLYSGSRLTASLGDDHRAFRFLGGWGKRHATPVHALLGIAGVSLLLIWLVGTGSGKSVLDATLGWTGDRSLKWTPGEAGFDTLVTGTAPTFWMFFCLTAAAVPVLRWREPQVERPFRCGVAVTPVIFGATSIYMLWSSLTYARSLSLLGLVILIVGAMAYAVGGRTPRQNP